MSIIIQFNSAFSQSAIAVPSTTQCHSKRNVKLEMVPGIEHSDVPGMTDDENSIDIPSSSVFSTTLKEVKITPNHFGSCFGLPYQDHNYGAPPPPTPPTASPCPSPSPSVPLPDEDTTLSVISNSTNEEIHEESVTRCICGFEHDDEYMICCDNCLVWQHVDCMGIDRNNIPDTYLCDKCEPRKLDRHKAKLLQSRKKNSLTAKSPTSMKQDFNNRLFGKDSKRKLQNTEEWAHKTEFRDAASISQRFYYSSDSDEGLNKNSERRPKTRSKRRKREEERALENLDQGKQKSKKHGKERMEAKRSKLRRGKNKESTSTADEEAQDAWEYSLEWCEKNFEDAINNQYTPEIQHLARTLCIQGFEKKYLEQMRTKQCHAYDDGKRKQLVCLRDLPRNSPLIEYKGKFLLASQFHDIHPLYNKRLYPYVLFYVLEQEEICVDASMYGNDARFVRRSCKPNAEIRHMVYNGKLHLYLTSTKVIFREDEVTIPLIIHPNDSLKEFECACGTDECLVKPKKKNGTIEICQERKRRTRRSTMTADEDSNHSVDTRASRHQNKANTPCEKPKQIPIKNEPIEPQVVVPIDSVATTPAKEEPEMKNVSDYETEEPSSDGKRKQTREERKLDAILRAFRQMEQAEKRKQLALEKQKSHQPKVEVPEEKAEDEVKEEKPAILVAETTPYKDEEKVTTQTPKSKKGKRRRGSGTSNRRRTRTNSGGSDLISLDEASPTKVSQPIEANPTVCSENVVQVPCSSPTPVSSSGLTSPLPSGAPSSPHILKTKRSLMNEWLQEKSEAAISTPVSSPLPIHTEMKWNMSAAAATCYVRCTKDTPHSSGISAAHLRRSNSATHLKPATGQGSAKKRWLRQAMYDCHGCEIEVKYDPCGMEPPSSLDNGYLSPNSHGDVDSLNGVGDDVLTPLKKRRLMRESIESLPSPQSPSTATSIDDTDATTVSNSLISDNSTEHGIDTGENESCCIEKEQPSSNNLKDSSFETDEDNLETSKTKEGILKVNGLNPKVCVETSFASISALELISDESNVYKTVESFRETSIVPLINKNIENEHIDSLNPSDLCEKSHIRILNTSSDSHTLETCTDIKTSPVARLPDDNILLDIDKKMCTSITISKNHSSSEVTKADILGEKDLVAQEQSQDPSTATIAFSFVNNTDTIEKSKTLPTNHNSCPSNTNSDSSITMEHSPISSSSDKYSKSEFNLSMQDDNKNIFQNKNVKNHQDSSPSYPNIGTLKSPETMLSTNKPSGHSTNGSPANTHNQILYSSVSSCNNVDISNSSARVQWKEDELAVKMEGTKYGSMKDSETLNVKGLKTDKVTLSRRVKNDPRCAPKEDTSPDTKNCASATKKRKVSLSEYRMRMRENTVKVKSNSETSAKNASATAICAIALPDTLPEQVTLAPLPLFDKMRMCMSMTKQEMQQTMIKKGESTKKEEELSMTEHRENLNERLKREFGFDVSEGSTNISALNSTIPGATVSDALKLSLDARPSPPPPPPPPRHRLIRPSASVNVMPPSQFGFPALPFPRPQFMVNQVSGAAPYHSTQAPIPVHQMNTNSGSLQPPLLPSPHPFASSMTGALLRPPHSPHDYTPVNAQQFAALVQQPPPPPPSHKSYLHVYPSGLYK